MIYERTIDLDAGDSLAKLARWIRPGTTVLELGAATGYFTAHLHTAGCIVDVIELDPVAAARAAPHARRTIVADLDTEAWVAPLGDARYEVIVCADVLEHLREPGRLLTHLRERLVEGGELLVSVPNVAHGAIVARLIDDHFEYGGEGLLDPTHLHLYTWRSLQRLLNDAGFTVLTWDSTTIESFDTEFRIRVESLRPPLREVLTARPHAHVYQWLARAGIGGVDAGDPPPTRAVESIPVRLLSAHAPRALSLDHAPTVRVPIGAGTIECSWPIAPGSGVVRLLLADRTGLMRIDRCQVQSGPVALWELGDAAGTLRCSEGVVPLGDGLYAVARPDGWVEPDVAPELLVRADRMTATLAWPGSVAEAGDYPVLAALVTALGRSRADREVAMERRIRELEQALLAEQQLHADTRQVHCEARRRLAEAEDALALRHAHILELGDSIAAYRAEAGRLEEALAVRERTISYRQSFRWWLALPLFRVRLWLRGLARR